MCIVEKKNCWISGLTLVLDCQTDKRDASWEEKEGDFEELLSPRWFISNRLATHALSRSLDICLHWLIHTHTWLIRELLYLYLSNHIYYPQQTSSGYELYRLFPVRLMHTGILVDKTIHCWVYFLHYTHQRERFFAARSYRLISHTKEQGSEAEEIGLSPLFVAFCLISVTLVAVQKRYVQNFCDKI